MHGVFGYVVVIVGGVGVLIAFVALIGSGRTWDEFQSRGMVRDGSAGPDGFTTLGGGARPSGGGPSSRRDADAARAEQREEIRQMLEARNLRRVRRGEAPVDVDAEIARLEAGGHVAAASRAGTGLPGPAGTGLPGTAGRTPARQPPLATNRNPELLDEVRALVEVRNRRRVRRGEPALDVDAEVERELRLLSGETD